MTALRIERAGAAAARVSGDLGFADAAAAWSRAGEFLVGAAGELAVDVAGVSNVDSATLAVLLAWAAHARRAGVVLRFRQAPAGLAALAHLCGTESLLGMA